MKYTGTGKLSSHWNDRNHNIYLKKNCNGLFYFWFYDQLSDLFGLKRCSAPYGMRVGPATQPCPSPLLDLSCEKENNSQIPVHQSATEAARYEGRGGGTLGCWMIIMTVQMPPPVCLPLLITLTSPDGQNAALPRMRLQRLDNRLSAAAWGKVSNGCLLLF